MTFTDPPYTLAGAVLFLSRAAAAVRQRGSVFLSFGPGRPGSRSACSGRSGGWASRSRRSLATSTAASARGSSAGRATSTT
ncbi:MAG: hypothetical protein E6G20_03715 [Actinobacteria bacterium]|nr:MAG: hypothetical protein E6G28_08060 [Actinomycetota bacterium]TML48952.1 MAG: hypothetical protein E6G20_03715 [Actinomycetota bacterium]